MKILFDQNISFRVLPKIKFIYTEAKQVRELGLENSSDRDIWQYAKQNHYTIVTFDADFFDMANLFGHPPKIIWLRVGNRNTNHLAEFLLSKFEIIQSFINDDNYSSIACLELND
jgi:predicted nuclease of predicted toxin-antitoxin system